MDKRDAAIDVTTNRENTFDVMKCIGIIAVIIGHLTSFGQDFIFSWHMPLFFIIAGYFYHEKGITTMLKKDAKHLLLPYAITCLVIVAGYALLSIYQEQDRVTKWIVASLYASGSNHSSRYFPNVPIIGAIWFLWALFWCKNCFNILLKVSHKYILLNCLIISILAIIIDNCHINLPLAILPGLSAILFYGIGWKIKQMGGFRSIKNTLLVICIVTWIISIMYSNMYIVSCYYKHYPINVIGACGGTYTIWLISDFLSKSGKWFLSFILWIGRNSMTFLCIHLIDLDCPTKSLFHIPNIFAIPYDILLCIICTFVLSKIPFTRMVYNIK